MSAWAVIVAGGTGTRMGSAQPKQLLTVGGITIIERTVRLFAGNPEIEGIVVAAAESAIDGIREALDAYSVIVVIGGAERQDSVINALGAVPDSVDVVLVHDAVRPFVQKRVIAECIAKAREFGAVSVMRPLKETIKVVEDGIVVETPDRSRLWITQTPQAFRIALLRKAHERARKSGFKATDDCMLVEELGIRVHCVEGDDYNIKITTPADMVFAEAVCRLFEQGDK